jgi:hypothetical protein
MLGGDGGVTGTLTVEVVLGRRIGLGVVLAEGVGDLGFSIGGAEWISRLGIVLSIASGSRTMGEGAKGLGVGFYSMFGVGEGTIS